MASLTCAPWWAQAFPFGESIGTMLMMEVEAPMHDGQQDSMESLKTVKEAASGLAPFMIPRGRT
jgi:hypothetical protein